MEWDDIGTHMFPLKDIAEYLQKLKGEEVMENVAQKKGEGGFNLIDARNRIEAIKIKEVILADRQLLETDNTVYEVGTQQQTIYKQPCNGFNLGNTNRHIQEKCVKLETKRMHEIMFPKEKYYCYKEIYQCKEPKLVSANYLMLYNLLPTTGYRLCSFYKQEDETLAHIVFHCNFLARVRTRVKNLLSIRENIPFNRGIRRIIEMMRVEENVEKRIISLYTFNIWPLSPGNHYASHLPKCPISRS